MKTSLLLALLSAAATAAEPPSCVDVPQESASVAAQMLVPFQNRDGLLGSVNAVFERPTAPPVANAAAVTARVGAPDMSYFVPASSPWTAGTFGAASCVAVIVTMGPPSARRVLIAHFTAEADPAASLTKLESRCGFKAGGRDSEVYIAGGDDSRGSNRVLSGLIDALRSRGAERFHYFPYQSIYLDDQGRLTFLGNKKSQVADNLGSR
jgi:hypothetical protein